MNTDSPIYITTTLPYVNADPHIGFALEAVHADVYARIERGRGRAVFFSIGSDEHGQKILNAAEKAGQDVQTYVDSYARKFQTLKQTLNLSNDAFIRTTYPKHIHAAQEMWRRCHARGDIEKRKYRGLYCVGCERFIQEKELVNGLCPDHDTKPETLEEENYFFKLSRYEEALLAYLDKQESIIPEWRRQEAIAFVKEGLQDFSISREKKRLRWGIPVPDDDEQVMYVWFDALVNYISTLDWPDDTECNFKRFWEDGYTVQFAGKDQVRFQSLIWQAMLLSAGIVNTDTVIYHGFITSAGKKMSKSIGNVVNPVEIVDTYGTDALRFFLLFEISPFEDGDFTTLRFHESYTAYLVNGIGNLTSRIMKMAEDNDVEALHCEDNATESVEETLDFKQALNIIWSHIARIDQRITEEEPFKVVKTDTVKGKMLIQNLLIDLHKVAVDLAPFLPETSEKILTAIKENKKPESLFARKEQV